MKSKLESENIRNWVVTIFITVLVLVLAFVCVIGLWQSFTAFTESQQTFSVAYSDAAAAIATLPSDQNETIKTSIDHLERLQLIQKNAVTNDMMSFLYSTLTTVLIGLCVGFVVKARKYADDASDNSKKAADDAKKAKSHSEQIEKVAAEMKEISKRAAENQKKLEVAYEIQKATTKILSIHIGMVNFRAALISGDRIIANERIYNVYTSVVSLPNTVDKRELSYMLQELLKLHKPIDVFMVAENEDEDERNARSDVGKQYKEWVTAAVKKCDIILKT